MWIGQLNLHDFSWCAHRSPTGSPRRKQRTPRKARVTEAKKNLGMKSKNSVKHVEKYLHQVSESEEGSSRSRSPRSPTPPTDDERGKKKKKRSTKRKGNGVNEGSVSSEEEDEEDKTTKRKKGAAKGKKTDNKKTKGRKRGRETSDSSDDDDDDEGSRKSATPKKEVPRQYVSPTGKKAHHNWTLPTEVEINAVPWLENHDILWNPRHNQRHRTDLINQTWEDFAQAFPPYSGQ